MKTSAKQLTLYRKRLIPAECILLKDDVILQQTDDIIITKWNTLNPKTAFSHGCSCYFLKEGYKVSKFYRADNSLLYWYCDIVDYDFQEDRSVLTVTDLLADVVIYPDGNIQVLDLDELAQASESGLLEKEKLHLALYRLSNLLDIIYKDKFDRLQAFFAPLDL